MNTIVWALALVVLGIATGRVVGALSAFTRGRVSYDLLAGGLGALVGGGLLRSIGPLSVRAPLLTLLGGVGAAFLATWLTRIATWPAEPPLQRPDDAVDELGAARQRHELMTTGEGSRLLLKQGHLVSPRMKDAETQFTS